MLTKKETILSMLVMVLVLQVGSTQLSAQECGQPAYITDKTSGCQIWNACPQTNESMTWSGQCVDGKAHGKGQLQWYQNDELKQIFFGEMVNGRDYQGKVQIQFYQNGELQSVQWGKMVKGDWQGKIQTQFYENGGLSQIGIGEMVNGQWQGNVQMQHYQNGELFQMTIGEMVNGQWQGNVKEQNYQNGELLIVAGEKVNGQWQGNVQWQSQKNGKIESVEMGEMVNGQRQGKNQFQLYENGELSFVVVREMVNEQDQGDAQIQWYENGEIESEKIGENVNGEFIIKTETPTDQITPIPLIEPMTPYPFPLIEPMTPLPLSGGDGGTGKPMPPKPITPLPSQPKTITNSIGMKFVLIPAGDFQMGCDPLTSECQQHVIFNNIPRHKVSITHPFYMGSTEVTQAQWYKVTGENPSQFTIQSMGIDTQNHPVEKVTWENAQIFLQRLNAREGTDTYRLPTEAEWEYACRAGTAIDYSFGYDAGQVEASAWYGDNSMEQTHAVGQRQPNAWGLYDMLGNVEEWCQDRYDPNYYESSPASDPKGPSRQEFRSRVVRGGSWHTPFSPRCDSRNKFDTESWLEFFGFRVVRDVSTSQSSTMQKTSPSDEQNPFALSQVQSPDTSTENPPSTEKSIRSHCDRVCDGESGLFGAAEALERDQCGCPFDKSTTCRAKLLDCTSKCAGLNILPGPKDTTCEPKCQKNYEECMK